MSYVSNNSVNDIIFRGTIRHRTDIQIFNVYFK